MLDEPCGIIFDFDGVIADSMSHHLDAWQAAHNQLVGRPIANVRRFVGMSTRGIARQLAAEAGDPALEASLITQKHRCLEGRSDSVPLYPRVADVFEHLRVRGVPFGIATNARRAFVEGVFRYHNMGVPVLVTLDDVSAPKPSPEPFVTCARRLGFSPATFGRLWVLEDSTHGLDAAKAAGMVPIGVMTSHDEALLRKHGARRVVSEVGELLSPAPTK